MMTKKTPKNANNFYCDPCDFMCCKKSDWDRHIITLKHKKNDNDAQKNANTFSCENCGKNYKYRQGLSVHRKKCPFLAEKEEEEKNEKQNSTPPIEKETEVANLTSIVLELLKSNSELQKHVIQMCQPNTNSHNTINSHNKTFNLQFFLNEQCKDAMNIMDFVNSVTLQLSDLESVGKLGYVEGISNIMIKKLNEIDVYKRPVHCSDAKRETLYVKDNNIWEKENASHSKLRKAIKYISKKNSDLLLTWRNQYPASKNIQSKQNEEYMKMVHQAMGGIGDVEENENKIIKRISKMVLIEK